MKLWTLQFLHPGPVSSARVAAPSDGEAVQAFALLAGISPDEVLVRGVPRRDVVLTCFCGERPEPDTAVLRVVRGDGVELLPDPAGEWHEARQS